MTCHEARGQFGPLLAGALRLTELAAVEAHAAQCPECGQALDRLYRTAPPAPARRPADTMRVPMPRRRPLGPRIRRLAVITALPVALVGLGLYGLGRLYEYGLSHPWAAQPITSLLGGSSPDKRVPSPPEESVAAEPTPPVITVPAERAPQGVTQAKRAEPEPQNVVQTKRIPRGRAAKAEPPVEPVIAPAASGTDIVVQLSVPDRRAAERDVRSLLVRLGGTSVNRGSASTMVLVVPRSRYGELTRGLAQIGAWQLESDPGALPDPVHVALRLTK